MPEPKKRVTESLPLRITVVDPPAGVMWALQLGQHELVQPTSSSKSRICFDFAVDAVPDDTLLGFHLRGRAVQGRLGERFVYLCSGAYAGQLDTPIGRRAKIRLEGISRKLITASKAKRAGKLEARFAGTDSKGGAACATVPLLGKGWNVS
ncbi:MAG: DUF5990 family protein [Steroidobacteraceae bacterium]